MRRRYRLLTVVLLGMWLGGSDVAADANAADRRDAPAGATDASALLPAARIAVGRAPALGLGSESRYVAVRR